MSEEVGSEISALQYNIERFEDWVSPVTPFEFEVSRPVEECASRLLDTKRTGLKTLFAGVTFEPEVVADDEGGYHFFVSQNGVDNLRAKGLLINLDAQSTSVEGMAFLSNRASFAELGMLCLIFALIGGVFGGLIFHSLVGMISAGVVWIVAIPVCGYMFRSYALTKQREFVGLITMALMLDAHDGSPKHKKRVM